MDPTRSTTSPSDESPSEKPTRFSDTTRPKSVLCVKAECLDGLGFAPGWTPADERDVEDLLDAAVWMPRTAALEADEGWRQVIPYVVVTDREANPPLVLSYRRSRAGGEARLHEKRSVGFGGHIDLDDALGFREPIGTLMRAAGREVGEELGCVPAPGTIRVRGIIRHDQDAVGRVHVGVGCTWDGARDRLHPGPEVADLAWMDAYRVYLGGNLEDWSAIALRALLYGPAEK